MIGHIFSLITLVIIFIYLKSKSDVVFEKNKVMRIALMVLSTGFSVLYFIYGIISINKGFSIVSLFKMEYGLIFVYLTYRLFILNIASGYCIHPEVAKNQDDTIERIIKDTMICLEDEDFEKALCLIDKVEARYEIDQNVVLLKTIINRSLIKEEVNFSQTFCF